MIPYVRTGGLHLHVVLGKVSVRYGRAMLVEVILYCNVETSGTFLVQISQRSPTNASHPCSPWSARVSRRFDFPLSAGHTRSLPSLHFPFLASPRLAPWPIRPQLITTRPLSPAHLCPNGQSTPRLHRTSVSQVGTSPNHHLIHRCPDSSHSLPDLRAVHDALLRLIRVLMSSIDQRSSSCYTHTTNDATAQPAVRDVRPSQYDRDRVARPAFHVRP